MSRSIYKSLWVFLMMIANLYDFIRWWIFCIQWHCVESYNSISNSEKISEIQYLEACKKELKKIPKHLSIIIGLSQTINSEVLSKIAVYALICDIDCISFYDTRCQFTLEHVEIPRYVSSKKIQNGRFLWSMPGNKKKSGQLRYKNGLEKSIEVVTLSSKDGKPLLVEVCKDLLERKKSERIHEATKDNSNSTKKIHESLQVKLNNLPEPDLAIVFDKLMCTYGLLPWHTGFTEFHTVETDCYFTVKNFTDILYKFSKCEQRFGK